MQETCPCPQDVGAGIDLCQQVVGGWQQPTHGLRLAELDDGGPNCCACPAPRQFTPVSSHVSTVAMGPNSILGVIAPCLLGENIRALDPLTTYTKSNFFNMI